MTIHKMREREREREKREKREERGNKRKRSWNHFDELNELIILYYEN